VDFGRYDGNFCAVLKRELSHCLGRQVVLDDSFRKQPKVQGQTADLSLNRGWLKAVIRRNGWSFYEKASGVNPRICEARCVRSDCLLWETPN